MGLVGKDLLGVISVGRLDILQGIALCYLLIPLLVQQHQWFHFQGGSLVVPELEDLVALNVVVGDQEAEVRDKQVEDRLVCLL